MDLLFFRPSLKIVELSSVRRISRSIWDGNDILQKQDHVLINHNLSFYTYGEY